MFLGHYATALVPYEKTRQAGTKPSIVLFLIAAQWLDFLMIAFVSMGLEAFEPALFHQAAFATMQTDMVYSHDLVPVVCWAIVFGLVVLAWTRQKTVAAWCVGLVLFHEVLDLAVGFEHSIWGHDTATVGLDLYHRAPVAGLLAEALFCAAIIWWFDRQRQRAGRPISSRLRWSLYAILVGGTLATLPMATQPLASLLG